MHAIELKDPAGFGNEFLRLTLLQGFQSLTKRDLELLIFVLLERDGAVDRGASNATVALQLRVTPAKVKGLRRDVVAKKLAKRANARNLVKRIARECFRRNRVVLPAVDMVVRLHAPVAPATRAELNQDLLALFQRLPRQ